MASDHVGFRSDSELKKRLEKYCDETGKNKSDVLKNAINDYLRARGFGVNVTNTTKIERVVNHLTSVFLALGAFAIVITLLYGIDLTRTTALFLLGAAAAQTIRYIEPDLSVSLGWIE